MHFDLKVWQRYDPAAVGVIDPDDMKNFFRDLPPPLGITSHATPFEIETAADTFTWTDTYDYSFNKTLHALASYFMLQQKRSKKKKKSRAAGFDYSPHDAIHACRIIRRAVGSWQLRKMIKRAANKAKTLRALQEAGIKEASSAEAYRSVSMSVNAASARSAGEHRSVSTADTQQMQAVRGSIDL